MQAIMCHVAGLTVKEHLLWTTDDDFRHAKESQIKYSACKGGTLYEMARHYFRSGAVEDSCVPKRTIQAHLQRTGELPLCSSLTGNQQNLCVSNPPQAQRVWPVLDFYMVSDSKDLLVLAKYMKFDICSKGPLVVGFNMYEDFLKHYDGTSIYIPKPNQPILGGHAVKVVGWGADLQDGQLVSFWLCANSWGKHWGDEGYFRMQIGNAMLQAEYNHLSLIPQVPGILQFYPLSQKISKIRTMDRALRDAIGVNPFTLYTKQSTQLIEEHKLKGGSPIFAKLKYDAYPFQCRQETTERPKWEQTNGRILLPLLILLGALGTVLMLGIIWTLLF
jgi:hypothetical protein